MKNTHNTDNEIKSVNLTPASPVEAPRYYVDNFTQDEDTEFDRIQAAADEAAAGYCMAKRQHRAERAEKLARKVSR